jgi:hypothetical protein
MISLMSPGISADDEVLARFNRIAQKAAQARLAGGDKAAIVIYEEALLDPKYTNYGGIHLRLGQLQKVAKRNSAAAFHFRRCIEDTRVDQIDRDIICKNGFDGVTTTLTIENLPFDAQVTIVEPIQFAGPFTSGSRLPKGQVQLEVKAEGQENGIFVIVLNSPLVWQAKTGLRKRAGPLIPDGFLLPKPGTDTTERDMMDEGPESIRWPAYTAVVVGAALIGTGISIGHINRDRIRQIRQDGRDDSFYDSKTPLNDARQTAIIADSLWIGGLVCAASSVAFWYLFDGEDTQ